MSTDKNDVPLTVTQLAAAMKALGFYDGENTVEEHAVEAKRLGGDAFYRMVMVNSILGIIEAEAIRAHPTELTRDQLGHALQQSLRSAGVENNAGKLLSFLRWRVLRVSGPLHEIAQDHETGPLPVSVEHASHGPQAILSVCADGHNLAEADPYKMTAELKAARQSLVYAIGNLDIMLGLLGQVQD